MSSDGTTARQAYDQRRSVDDVSVPSREKGTQSVARYRGAVPMRQRRVKMMTIIDALRHVKPMEIVMHQLRQ